MTREQAKDLLPIVQAWADGKTVQYRYPPHDWHDAPMGANPFVESDWEWRVKPEPREFWLLFSKEFDHGPIVYHLEPLRAPGDAEIVHVREVI